MLYVTDELNLVELAQQLRALADRLEAAQKKPHFYQRGDRSPEARQRYLDMVLINPSGAPSPTQMLREDRDC